MDIFLTVSTDNDEAADAVAGYMSELGAVVKEFVEATNDPSATVRVEDSTGTVLYP